MNGEAALSAPGYEENKEARANLEALFADDKYNNESSEEE